MDDPGLVSKMVYQFLRPSDYSYKELKPIWGILFTAEERNLIHPGAVAAWTADHPNRAGEMGNRFPTADLIKGIKREQSQTLSIHFLQLCISMLQKD